MRYLTFSLIPEKEQKSEKIPAQLTQLIVVLKKPSPAVNVKKDHFNRMSSHTQPRRCMVAKLAKVLYIFIYSFLES